MLRKLFAIVLAFGSLQAGAQSYDQFVHSGEVGIGVGAAHYYGDLNTGGSFDRPKLSVGAFYRKQINPYISAKLGVNYALLGYADKYSKNEAQTLRNLSFNSNIWEFTVGGDFNFFKFNPGFEGYNYTPYVSLGVGLVTYDPYAYLDGTKYHLREYATEGQTEPYGSTALTIPLTVGFKYAFNENTNFFIEAGYRFTSTDYLDDVSTTYPGADAFPGNPQTGGPGIGALLSDRSYEVTSTPIGVKGRQRGNSSQKDGYAIMQLGVSFNLSSYKCPKYY